MPLFEIGDNELIPFRRVQAGPDLYEEEIESLLWANLDSFVGVQLFPLARQPTVGDGIRPDIVALDIDGHVHVIEVKRDVDRRPVSYTHLRAHETVLDLVCRLLLEKKNKSK